MGVGSSCLLVAGVDAAGAIPDIVESATQTISNRKRVLTAETTNVECPNFTWSKVGTPG